MTEDIRQGDFVQLDKPGAKTVGLVYRVEDGQALTWWHDGDSPVGRAITNQDKRPISDLKIVSESVFYPAVNAGSARREFPTDYVSSSPKLGSLGVFLYAVLSEFDAMCGVVAQQKAPASNRKPGLLAYRNSYRS